MPSALERSRAGAPTRAEKWRRGGENRRRRLRLAAPVALALAGTLFSGADAQQIMNSGAKSQPAKSADRVSSDALASSSPAQQASCSITGTVLDTTGALVPGATVTLTNRAGSITRSMVSGSNGQFTFDLLPPGDFRVSVTSPGMGTFVSPEIVLTAGDRRDVPEIVLPIASTSADVHVHVTLDQIATEQVHAEEQQRVLGVLPDFYTTYIWNAAPLPAKQKFQLAFRSIIDPVAFLGAGALAGAEQYHNTFPGYGQGADGYAKRFGAAYANDAIGRMIGSAILPSLLHQDPRYFYLGSGSVRSRALYALSRAFICKGDNGRWEPNYSNILGSFAAGGISNLYHPAGDRGVGLTFGNGLIEIAGNAGTNLIREFLLRPLTRNLPVYEKGKP